jgi:hypothetical protein
MRIALALSSGHFRKDPLLTMGTLAVVALAAYPAAEYVISGDFTGMANASMALARGAIVIGILNKH